LLGLVVRLRWSGIVGLLALSLAPSDLGGVSAAAVSATPHFDTGERRRFDRGYKWRKKSSIENPIYHKDDRERKKRN
jgi:hypothetical protein